MSFFRLYKYHKLYIPEITCIILYNNFLKAPKRDFRGRKGRNAMIHTVKFRIYPDKKQEYTLNEIFTIYNRVKRIGYNLLFYGEKYIADRFGEVKTIQQCLMSVFWALKVNIYRVLQSAGPHKNKKIKKMRWLKKWLS